MKVSKKLAKRIKELYDYYKRKKERNIWAMIRLDIYDEYGIRLSRSTVRRYALGTKG